LVVGIGFRSNDRKPIWSAAAREYPALLSARPLPFLGFCLPLVLFRGYVVGLVVLVGFRSNDRKPSGLPSCISSCPLSFLGFCGEQGDG
jgi:hypothetical protein